MLPVSSPEDVLSQGSPLGLQPLGCSLQQLPSPSAVMCSTSIAILVRRSLLVLGAVSTRQSTAPDLEVFPEEPLPRTRNGAKRPTRGVGPPEECDPVAAAASFCACVRGASREVSRLPRHDPPVESTNPGLPHPVRSASRVSHPLDGFLLDRLPGLVSCRSTLGAVSLQSFPLVRSRIASRRPAALLPLTATDRRIWPEGRARQPPCPARSASQRIAMRRLAWSCWDLATSRYWFDSRALLPGSSPLPPRRRLGPRGARCSPGFHDHSWACSLATAHRCDHQCSWTARSGSSSQVCRAPPSTGSGRATPRSRHKASIEDAALPARCDLGAIGSPVSRIPCGTVTSTATSVSRVTSARPLGFGRSFHRSGRASVTPVTNASSRMCGVAFPLRLGFGRSLRSGAAFSLAVTRASAFVVGTVFPLPLGFGRSLRSGATFPRCRDFGYRFCRWYRVPVAPRLRPEPPLWCDVPAVP